MLTMQLALNIDAQRFIQQIQIHNKDVEDQVQKGLDAAFEELKRDGVIEQMIKEAAKKNIMDSFTRHMVLYDLRKKIEEQITSKLSDKINKYTTDIVDQLATQLNLPKD